MICLNCSTKTIGHYCHECGQKTEDVRFTLKALARDLFFSAFDLEKKGLPNTAISLTVTPGNAIRAVLQGRRQSLYPPFKYLVLTGAVVIIFSLRYKFFNNELTQVGSKDMHVLASWIFIPEEYRTFIESFFKFAEDNATLLNIAAIPVFTFFSFAWLSGRKYNIAENLILNTYITAQQLFFLLLLIPFYELLPGYETFLIAFYTIVVILYNIWVYIQFFGTTPGNVFKSVMVVLVAYLYQFPLNFLIYYLHEYIHRHMHWIPQTYEKIVG